MVSFVFILVAFVIHGTSLGQEDRAQRITRETAPDPAQIELTPVADGFERPVFVTARGRWFQSLIRCRAIWEDLGY